SQRSSPSVRSRGQASRRSEKQRCQRPTHTEQCCGLVPAGSAPSARPITESQPRRHSPSSEQSPLGAIEFLQRTVHYDGIAGAYHPVARRCDLALAVAHDCTDLAAPQTQFVKRPPDARTAVSNDEWAQALVS